MPVGVICALNLFVFRFFNEVYFLSNVPVISFCYCNFVVLIVYFHRSSTV